MKTVVAITFDELLRFNYIIKLCSNVHCIMLYVIMF